MEAGHTFIITAVPRTKMAFCQSEGVAFSLTVHDNKLPRYYAFRYNKLPFDTPIEFQWYLHKNAIYYRSVKPVSVKKRVTPVDCGDSVRAMEVTEETYLWILVEGHHGWIICHSGPDLDSDIYDKHTGVNAVAHFKSDEPGPTGWVDFNKPLETYTRLWGEYSAEHSITFQ